MLRMSPALAQNQPPGISMPQQSLLALPALPFKVLSALNKTQLGTRRRERSGFRGCDCTEQPRGRSTAVLSSVGAVPGPALLPGELKPLLQSLHGGGQPQSSLCVGTGDPCLPGPQPRRRRSSQSDPEHPSKGGVSHRTRSHLHHTGPRCTHSPPKSRVSLTASPLPQTPVSHCSPPNLGSHCSHPPKPCASLQPPPNPGLAAKLPLP